ANAFPELRASSVGYPPASCLWRYTRERLEQSQRNSAFRARKPPEIDVSFQSRLLQYRSKRRRLHIVPGMARDRHFPGFHRVLELPMAAFGIQILPPILFHQFHQVPYFHAYRSPTPPPTPHASQTGTASRSNDPQTLS